MTTHQNTMKTKEKHGNTGNRNAAKDVTAESYIHCRCVSSDKANWVRSARAENKKLTQWITDKLNCIDKT